jgi:S-adenosylmethionine:tRNA ribosyltransferase-isomerase
MRVDDFDFELPRGLIADHPASPRDAARLLHVKRSGLADRTVRDLPDLLRPGDLLVVNDTRVIPARLRGRIGAGGIEVTLHKRVDGETWLAFARPGKKLKPGSVIDFPDGLMAEAIEKHEGGEVAVRFNRAGDALLAALEQHGEMPLPPYIKRAHGEASDRSDYQTMFAREAGAVAAPTAGLHFTPDLIARLEAGGIKRAQVTLHVGAGTFLPVKVDDTDDHRMHSEWGSIPPATVDAIATTRAKGGRIVAVGTTSLRLLESAAREDGNIGVFEGDTDIFITPGYRFKAVDLLLTNFHLPRSTLFMLVCAFAGMDRMRAAYDHAKATGYRFYSYGDACLLEREQ